MVFILGFSLSLLAAEKPESTKEIPDVQTIVKKANIVAYYQGKDGKATVKMTITNKRGQKRERQFNILRKDVEDGGDQKYFVYFLRPPDVRRTVYMVHKHADPGKDDDRWLYLPALDLDTIRKTNSTASSSLRKLKKSRTFPPWSSRLFQISRPEAKRKWNSVMSNTI